MTSNPGPGLRETRRQSVSALRGSPAVRYRILPEKKEKEKEKMEVRVTWAGDQESGMRRSDRKEQDSGGVTQGQARVEISFVSEVWGGNSCQTRG